jgi:hypothetical protein
MEILFKVMRQLRYSTPKIGYYINPDCSSVALNLGKKRLFSDFCIHLNCMCILAWNSMNRIMVQSASNAETVKNACQRIYR